MVDDPTQAIAVMKAMARREAGRESPLTDEQWRQAHAMFKAGSANTYLNSLASPSPSPPTERPLDLAAAIVAAMRRKGYIIDTQPGEINIVYVEGLNEDGTVNDDAADKWNDLRVVIGFEGDKPVMLGKWRATTEPGSYYTEHPITRPARRGSSSGNTRLGASACTAATMRPLSNAARSRSAATSTRT